MSTPHPADDRRRMRWGRLAIALILFTGTAFTAQYASANFTDPSTVSQGQLATGTLALTLGDGDAAQVFISALGFYPGAVYMRLINVTNGGNTDLKTVTVVPSDGCNNCSTTLTNDATNGLTINFERCSVPWVAIGGTTAPNKLYTCADAVPLSLLGGTKLLADNTRFATINNTEVALTTGLSSFSAGATYYYAVYQVLPSNTSVATMGQTGGATYTFKGTQRDAVAK